MPLRSSATGSPRLPKRLKTQRHFGTGVFKATFQAVCRPMLRPFPELLAPSALVAVRDRLFPKFFGVHRFGSKHRRLWIRFLELFRCDSVADSEASDPINSGEN